jgi:hypothetical protein
MVKDAEGRPIAGARVRLDVEKVYEFSIGRLDQTVYSKTLTTDESGTFHFETSSLPKMTHRPFVITLSGTADGYADAKWWSWYSRRDTTVSEHLADITMQPGRVVRGRCVDPEGRPVAGAVVKFAGDYVRDFAPAAWAWDPRQTNEQGEFNVSVPRDGKRAVELWVAHPDFAPQHAVIPKNGTELADIRLRQGARVRGFVRREDGSPVAGAVVAASSIFDGNFDMITFPARVAVRTGADGQYQLPPLEGMYKLFLSQAEETDNRLEKRFVVGRQPPPLVVPKKVSLSGSEEKVINFESGPTLIIRGTARWPDGRPVEDMEVRASYLPSGFGTGIELGTTHTNKLGKYSFEVPKPIEQLSISASGKHDAQRTWHYAEAEETISGDYVQNKGLQFIMLKELKTDVGGMDWVLRADLPK